VDPKAVVRRAEAAARFAAPDRESLLDGYPFQTNFVSKPPQRFR